MPCYAFVTTSQRRGSGGGCIGRLELQRNLGRIATALLPSSPGLEILLHLRNAVISKVALLYYKLYTVIILYILGIYIRSFLWKLELKVR